MILFLSMTIVATTSMRCKGRHGPHNASRPRDYNFTERNTIVGLHEPINIQSDPEAEAFDIGAFLLRYNTFF